MKQKINYSKIGKYGRPIFWAGSMSYLLYFFFKIIENLFTSDGREFLSSVFNSVGDIIFYIFMLLILMLLLVLSIYKVTHPHTSKDEYDDSDEGWGIGICIVVSIILLHIILQYFFDLDFLGFSDIYSDPTDYYF